MPPVMTRIQTLVERFRGWQQRRASQLAPPPVVREMPPATDSMGTLAERFRRWHWAPSPRLREWFRDEGCWYLMVFSSTRH